MKINKTKIFFPTILISTLLFAQTIIDGIAAIVGENIILISEVEQVALITASQMNIDPNRNVAMFNTIKRNVLNSLIDENVILEQARIETVEVKDRDVENAINQRLDMLVEQVGSVENLELLMGSPISKIKKDYRPIFKNQMIVEKMRTEKFSKVTISRPEVEAFYQTYKDSLPPIPPSLDFSTILFKVNPGPEEEMVAKKLIDSLYTLIKNGYDFEELAKNYSEDEASAKYGGDLGYIKRGAFIKSFEEVAFSLSPGEISNVIRTDFGYHIIQMVDRKGESINVRHILIKIKTSDKNFEDRYRFADSIRTKIINNEISFDSAVVKYSDEPNAKTTLGRIRRIPLNQIQNSDFVKILSIMNVGDISPVFESSPGYYILKLNNIYDDTWPTIEKYALEFKKNQLYQEWLSKLKKDMFIDIKVNY
ncbi:MAG TPA: peptidylprolyl isomerase [Candidatus Marinimicrobia bacterium]|nr:peptidylprolyl isomerase [Candidatus Neomarinimicrobiota bacterium]HRS50853.1 peptidylprolyl isomerase [Candidatus Neomarinimicrobiota bacterium]HRU91805.1 peptidylprolyl isomerase [Candidatus Neomarinimicrobiota bacterium]